ncbi:proto-oncogene DBL isoform X8 [Salvelinus alpinus]|uniref:proto-oncogene DBL isoform X8 n=1 Tax=Salvelinus alpinus TaxID=8036 RepID=UPI0039FDC18F
MAEANPFRGLPRLRRAAMSFPGNLHLVLVLRPTSLLQSPSGTGTDLGFRFSQEDFMLKMPVVMLSSVTDLLRYIDENQLTSEFGGTLEYCHSDWVVLRTAIESFAVTVKEIAQMLQSFGTELAETELPDEADDIEFLLRSHTDKYRQLKDDIRSVMREGRHLLSNLEAAKAAKADGQEDKDIKQDWDTVQRLLAQLRDMEMAFDGFFEKHHLKLQQYLQLMRYEMSFHEMEEILDRLSGQEKEVAAVGGTVVQTEQLLKDLESLDTRAQEEMGRAQIIILRGHQLATGHHYALALIVQRCNELRHHCDVLTTAIRAKRAALTRIRDLLLRLEESQIGVATEKLSAMQRMIHNRQACLRKLADIQIEVMHDYEENRNSLSYGQEGEESPDQLKRHIIKELIETERIYVEELLSVLLGYRAEMDNPALSHLLPSVLRSKKEVLFGNMPEIYKFHSRTFLQDLEGCLETPERVGACFLRRKEKFQVYERYCQNKPHSELLWRQCSASLFFQACQKKLEHKLGLDSYLLKPVQRLTKYQLLLKELLKHSADSDYISELQGALESMLNLLKSVNDSMHQIAITGYEGELSDLGRVLMQGSFSVWISHKRGPTRMKARFKPMQRHLFLHEHALLFCKRREEHGEGHDRTPFYSFKHCLRMSAVGITENVKGDVKKFELWYSGREEVYVVQAPTFQIKIAWLTEIRKILTNQQRLLQEDIPPIQLSEQTPLSPPSTDSLAHMSVCMPWSTGQTTGCSGCFDVLPHSKPLDQSLSTEEAESSGRTSPVLTDPVVFSPQPQHNNRRSWPGTSHSVDICEGPEDWSTTDLSNLSDSDEEDDPTPLVPGRYRALVESSVCSTDDLIIKCGDVIQLLDQDTVGKWLVRNVSRCDEGRVSADNLHRILGESGRAHSGRMEGNQKTRKLSSL